MKMMILVTRGVVAALGACGGGGASPGSTGPATVPSFRALMAIGLQTAH